ncbi:MAG: DegV family protein [Clostridia bacterium]|nr:DegV family protein [Clostridia bacterium]
MEAEDLSKIAIVTDSTCDLDRELAEKLNIHILPLKVVFSQEEQYQDGIEITPEEVYARMPHETPSTSMPGPGEIKALFQRLKEEGYTQIVAIHISTGLSSTLDVVKMVAKDFPELEIETVDSKALSLALGFLVLKAVQLRDLGIKFHEIIEQLNQTRQKIKVFFVVKTLEYLKKGGRIGLVSGSLGQVLDVKPIISINEDGKYYTFSKVRGRVKSLAKLKEIVLEKTKGRTVTLAVAHSDALEEAKTLYQELLESTTLKIKESWLGQIGPVMGVHAGPGLIGVAYEELS